MSPVWLFAALASGSPLVDAHVGASAPVSGDAPPAGILGAGVSLGVVPRFRVEARLDGRLAPTGGALQLGPALRAFLVHPDRKKAWRPSIRIGGAWSGGVVSGPRASAGLDLDLPTGWPTHARIGLGAETGAFQDLSLQLRIGVVAGPWRRRPTPMVVDTTPVAGEVAAANAGADVNGDANAASNADVGTTADARASVESGTGAVAEGAPVAAAEGPSAPTLQGAEGWWDPRSCTWVDADPGGGWRPSDGVGSAASAADTGAESASGASGAPPEDADAAQGWLMVVASAGDRVVLGEGVEQVVGVDGLARLRSPEGVVDVAVVGGGRRQSFEAAIADGYALWLRAAPPGEVQVTFGSGSSTITAENRVFLQTLARERGGWTLRLSGSYSPEGNRQRNLELARDRAAAVRATLVEAGVPADALVIDPPTPPRAGLSAARQRAVYVNPELPESAP